MDRILIGKIAWLAQSACSLVLWGVFAATSSAGIMLTTKETCASAMMAGAPQTTRVFLDKASFNPTHTANIVIRDPPRQSGNPNCETDTTLQLVNEAAGPQFGTMLDAESLGATQTQILLTQFYQLWTSSAAITSSYTNKATRCTYDWCAERPALRFSGGLSIKEASAAFYFAQTTLDMQSTRRLAIPFVVVSAGKGDWLEFSNRGRVFWKAPVDLFAAGHLYFAVVPDSMLTDSNTVWGIYVNSSAPSDTEIYLPTYALPATSLGIH